MLVTDGQAWSGEVARALKTARSNDVPVWVVGVGTTVGAFIPEAERKPNDTSPREPPIRAALDRGSLMQIANAGGGEYMELDREGDRDIANRIIDAARKRAGSRGLKSPPRSSTGVSCSPRPSFMTIGLLFLQEKTELWLQAARRRGALTFVWTLTR